MLKNIFYAGAKVALLDDLRESNMLMMKEVTDRFGSDKIGLISHSFDKDIYHMAVDNNICLNILSQNCSASVQDF